MLKRIVSGIMLWLLLEGMLFSSIMLGEGEPETHDLEVSLTAPIIRYNNIKNHFTNGSSTVLNVTVINNGDFIEHNVNLQLLINSSIALNSTVFKLVLNGTFWTSYFWAPEEGVYNLTAYAPPVPGESPPHIANNIVTRWVNVSVDEAPHCDFTYSPRSPPPNPHPVKNEPITFNASYPISYDPDWGTILNYTWDFGDGNTTIIGDDEPITPIITHKYTDDEFAHNVTLTLADTEDLISNKTKSIKVYFPPIASFSYSGHHYVDYPVTFTASASSDPDNDTGPTHGIATYTWDFGDGSPPLVRNHAFATHTYTANNTYWVNLTVTDYDHLSNSKNRSITIGLGIPKADFTIDSPSPYYVDEALIFNASSSVPNGEPIVDYIWNFGDGKNDTGIICPHAFTEARVYNVTLTVIDDKGWEDNETKPVDVILPVHIGVEPSPVSSNPGETFKVSITVANVVDLYSVVFELAWPGGMDRLVDVLYAYPGNFTGLGDWFDPEYAPVQGTVWVNATRDISGVGVDGNWTVAVIFFEVRERTGNHTLHFVESSLKNSTCSEINHTQLDGYFYTTWPVADFSYSRPVIPHEPVTFNASCSYDPDNPYDATPGPITNYWWDFGDGTNDTGKIATHIFSSGPFQVNLTVTDDDGETWWITHLVSTPNVTLYVKPCTFAFNETTGFYETAGKLPITVSVTNNGMTTETFTVTVYANETIFDENQTVPILSGQSENLTFYLDASELSKGTYNISACVSGFPGKEYADHLVEVHLAGDVDRDGDVDLYDSVRLLTSYGAKNGDPHYDPNCDLYCDGQITLYDAVILLTHYGQKDP